MPLVWRSTSRSFEPSEGGTKLPEVSLPPPLPPPRFVPVDNRTAGEPPQASSTYLHRATGPYLRRSSSDAGSHSSQASNASRASRRFGNQRRSSSAAGSVCSQASSNVSKASQRSWEEDDVFDQALQIISQELGDSIKALEATSVSRLTMILTKTGRNQRDMQRAFKRELERFQKIVTKHYGISGWKVQAGVDDISEAYRECRSKQKRF